MSAIPSPAEQLAAAVEERRQAEADAAYFRDRLDELPEDVRGIEYEELFAWWYRADREAEALRRREYTLRRALTGATRDEAAEVAARDEAVALLREVTR